MNGAFKDLLHCRITGQVKHRLAYKVWTHMKSGALAQHNRGLKTKADARFNI